MKLASTRRREGLVTFASATAEMAAPEASRTLDCWRAVEHATSRSLLLRDNRAATARSCASLRERAAKVD